MIIQLALSLNLAVPGKAATATWVVIEAPGLALMAAFTGAAAAAGGAWWARRRDHASGTTLVSIGYGIGTAAIAAAVVAVLAWASINEAVSGKVALAAFAASLAGGLLGSVRVGGAVLGGLVGVLVSMLIGTAGGLVFTWTLSDADPDPRALGVYTTSALLFTAVVKGISVSVGTVVGSWWLTRRRLETPLPYLVLVGSVAAMLQLVSLPIAWLAALPVADDLPHNALARFGPQQAILLLVAAVSGIATALTYYTVRRVNRRSGSPSVARPAAAH
jgi:hypothetical protein